ncbi:nicotinamide riboside transporter PnuC [Pedobacter sp. HMF7647]|uniref:Nicotinamide riboside transporter PnuC n=1 Tax=Hufsiella arboris TaxID=2695275 RepID=A0A7K1Y7B9_9SPHI|nr:nicotinamide riboside transporter PnuC [Hufsiella arboris]MXV50456.1 nicotinamide riboside transporter PnuC [Hufsiella arboris]
MPQLLLFDVQEWVSLFIDQFKHTTVFEWLAVGFGVAEVLLARKNNVLLYPAGIIATVISTVLLFNVQLYAESGLNIYYLVMSVYGWIHWHRNRNEPELPITSSSRDDWFITLAVSFGGWLVLYLILKYFTPSTVPVLDSFVSATAWAGMWLLARRKVENWILLNISNLVAIPLLFHKQLILFALLTIFLFVIAIFGYLDWKKLLKKNPTQTLQAA